MRKSKVMALIANDPFRWKCRVLSVAINSRALFGSERAFRRPYWLRNYRTSPARCPISRYDWFDLTGLTLANLTRGSLFRRREASRAYGD